VFEQNGTTLETMQSSNLHQHHNQANRQPIIFENIKESIKSNKTFDI
jgi:hypothetical protein